MKTIKLTQGKKALVDDIDYAQFSMYKWHAHSKDRPYPARTITIEGGKRKTIFLHHMILKCPKSKFIDHINGNPLDNRRANLRIATRSQNGFNRGVTKTKGIPYKGVHFYSHINRYVAVIKKGNKQLHIGCFGSAVCAALAFDKMAIKLHGKFAKLNFPLSAQL